MGGLCGLEEREALYESYCLDAKGDRLDTSQSNDVMRFPGGALPPTDSFWSITMYDGDKVLSENALGRYLINSAMAATSRPTRPAPS